MSAWNEGFRNLLISKRLSSNIVMGCRSQKYSTKFPRIYAVKQTRSNSPFLPVSKIRLHCQAITKFWRSFRETMMFRSNAAFKISAWNEDPKIEDTAHIFKHAIERRNSRSFSSSFYSRVRKVWGKKNVREME